MLEHHPWFEVAWLAASDRSAGQAYGDATRWRLKTPVPKDVRRMSVSSASPDGAPKIIFAALDAGIARELEPQFADAGCAVVSNSSAFRMQQDVPLVIPEVNADHIALIDRQALMIGGVLIAEQMKRRAAAAGTPSSAAGDQAQPEPEQRSGPPADDQEPSVTEHEFEQILQDVGWLDSCGVTEVFYDLNFDPLVGDPAVAEGTAMLRASEILEALAPDARL